jgi:hypothetical protein
MGGFAMRTRILALILCCLSVALFGPSSAWAGDAATVIFKSGQVVRIDDGYQQILDSMDRLDGKDIKHQILKMKIGGSSLLMDIAEVVIVCRDECNNVTILHQLDPRRGGGNSNVNVDNSSRTVVK